MKFRPFRTLCQNIFFANKGTVVDRFVLLRAQFVMLSILDFLHVALMSVCYGWNDFSPDFFANIVIFRRKIRARGLFDNAPVLLHNVLLVLQNALFVLRIRPGLSVVRVVAIRCPPGAL